MTFRAWPRRLGTRTAVTMLLGLALVQIAGLTIHGLDRIDLQRLAQAREVSERVVSVYRTFMSVAPTQRDVLLGEFKHGPGVLVELVDHPPVGDLPEMPPQLARLFRAHMNVSPVNGPSVRMREVRFFGSPSLHRIIIALALPDGMWLQVTVPVEPPAPWHSPTFLISFIVMTGLAAVLIIWGVRRLTAPVATLAEAASALGRDVNAPALPEDGPEEVAHAAHAFNTMAARIRRFVADRTELLTAIGHDLRTPITRLKLRAEFMEDAEQRTKMLADLAELEAMVSATLAFGRDARGSEPVVPLDLAELLRTLLDEAKDAWPAVEERLVYQGPAHMTVRARSMGLKRALSNLITNAVKYGGGATAILHDRQGELLRVDIEDDGPGIAPDLLERVFEPFHRGEPSRNRETGGVGLGLPIARNILRAHGGDVVLANRPQGGIRATVTLPA